MIFHDLIPESQQVLIFEKHTTKLVRVGLLIWRLKEAEE
jgi:hypothetical protein